MIVAADGRRVAVKPNGMSHLALLDDRSESHTIDHASAGQLAEALESGSNIRVGTNHGRVLMLQGVAGLVRDPAPAMARGWLLGDASVHMPAGRPQAPTGPWAFDEDQGRMLAEEIRAVLRGGGRS